MSGFFDRFRGRKDDEPVDMDARSPETGLKYKDLALLGEMMKQGTDLTRPRHALYYLYFGARDAAEGAAVEGRGRDIPAKFAIRFLHTQGSGRWCASDPMLS